MLECPAQFVQFIFSAFSVISGVDSSLSRFVFLFLFFNFILFFSFPDSKNKDFKALVWDFSAHHIDECKGVFLYILSMAHVKTAVSTLGPLYSLYSCTSGLHASEELHSVCLTCHSVGWSTSGPAFFLTPLPTSLCVRFWQM